MISAEHSDTGLRDLAEHIHGMVVGTIVSLGGRRNVPFGHGVGMSKHALARIWAFLKTDSVQVGWGHESWPFDSLEQSEKHADLVSQFPPIPDQQTLATFSKQQPSWAMVLWPLILIAILLEGALICVFLKNAGLITLR